MAQKNCLLLRLRESVNDNTLARIDDEGNVKFHLYALPDDNKGTYGGRRFLLGAKGPLEIRLMNATIKGLTMPDANYPEEIVNPTTYKTTGDCGSYSGIVINEDVEYVEISMATEEVGKLRYISSYDIDPTLIGDDVVNLNFSPTVIPNTKLTNLEMLSLEKKNYISMLTLRDSPAIGTTEQLALIPNKKSFTSLSLNRATKITGDISVLGVLTSLISMDLTDSVVTGTVESFVQKQVSRGRNTCNGLSVGFGPGNATFNGEVLVNKYKPGTTSRYGKVLSWTTSGNNITITVKSTDNTITVGTKTIQQSQAVPPSLDPQEYLPVSDYGYYGAIGNLDLPEGYSDVDLGTLTYYTGSSLESYYPIVEENQDQVLNTIWKNGVVPVIKASIARADHMVSIEVPMFKDSSGKFHGVRVLQNGNVVEVDVTNNLQEISYYLVNGELGVIEEEPSNGEGGQSTVVEEPNDYYGVIGSLDENDGNFDFEEDNSDEFNF